MDVAIQNPGRRSGLGLAALRPWLEDLLAHVATEADSFTLRLVGDREMAELNQQYRSRQGATDVLSFPGESGPEGRHLGDVVVAVPTARRQARERGHSLQHELRLLALHGVLHCLGYDHEVDDGEMERLESRLKRRYLAR